MRTKTVIVVLYACLSISAFHWKPVSTFESLALLFYKPWEYLWDLLPRESFTEDWNIDESLAYRTEDIDRSSHDLGRKWWAGVIPPESLIGDYLCLAGRATERIGADQNRLTYYLEDACDVAPGDPVAVGESLIGFISRIDPEANRADVVLLNHNASPPVLGEVRGTVAGKGVYFIAGGPSPGLPGCIDVQFPSSRFGLNAGSFAYSRVYTDHQTFPPHFLLGQVRLGRPKMGELQEEVALEPALEPWELDRIAVLVPFDRAGFEAADTRIPPIPMERIPVNIDALPVGSEPHPAFRVAAGMEEGLAPGMLLVRHGMAMARLSRVGLFSSFAEFLVAPGDEIVVAVLPESGVATSFRMKVIGQQGFQFLCEFKKRRVRITKGEPLFIAEQPCSGLELYPAFRIEETVDADRFLIRVPWSWNDDEAHCLRFTRAMERG